MGLIRSLVKHPKSLRFFSRTVYNFAIFRHAYDTEVREPEIKRQKCIYSGDWLSLCVENLLRTKELVLGFCCHQNQSCSELTRTNNETAMYLSEISFSCQQLRPACRAKKYISFGSPSVRLVPQGEWKLSKNYITFEFEVSRSNELNSSVVRK